MFQLPGKLINLPGMTVERLRLEDRLSFRATVGALRVYFVSRYSGSDAHIYPYQDLAANTSSWPGSSHTDTLLRSNVQGVLRAIFEIEKDRI